MANRPYKTPKLLRVCLVGPATETEFDDEKLVELVREQLPPYAPLGILTLAAVLELRGFAPHFVDLNLLYRDYLRSPEFRSGEADFCTFAARHFEPLQFDVFGFSTICGSYPLTLRIAREVKRSHPFAALILGGPQATVVDVETLRSFPEIDYIVRGEAEESFPLLLSAIAQEQRPDDVAGLTFRNGSEVVRNPNAAVIADLDQLPLPAFHLYRDLTGYRLCLELGRGCPFACSFCSTNDFFRRRFRLVSPARVITHMRELRNRYGNTSFNLVHDMFTVDRKRVVRFCHAILHSGDNFKWSCSARTDCVDDQLIDLMARAGCQGIFFGIETGSQRLQRTIKKHLVIEEARDRIERCDKRGIATTASLITGFPDETLDDLRDTTAFYIDMLRFDYVEPQLHLLSALGGTPLAEKYKDQLVYDDIVSDMSYQGWQQDPADRALIVRHREVFPNFYGVPTPGLNRSHLKELRDFLLFGKERFSWLLVALHQIGGHIVEIFDEFCAWRGDSERAPTSYYASADFRRDFVTFARVRYAKGKGGKAISTILDYDKSLQAMKLADIKNALPAPRGGKIVSREWDLSAVPRLADGMHVATLNADYRGVIRSLRRKSNLGRVRSRPAVVVTRKSSSGRCQVIQLSPLSAALLGLCDGSRSVAAISAEMATSNLLKGMHPEAVCLFGISELRQQGLLVP